MTLNQLQYFYQAAKTQHFNHAADNLSISQPSLSRAIAALENELGVILFERMGRNVALTKAGQIFYEQTEKILEDISVAERKMHQLAMSGGEICIAYVFPLSTHFIPEASRTFMQMDENKKVTWKKMLGVEFPVSEGDIHTLAVDMTKDGLRIEADEHRMFWRCEDLYESFHLGIDACEGLNRFYSMEITQP